MDTRVPLGTVAEGLVGQGDGGNPQPFAKGDPKKAREARCCTLAYLVQSNLRS
jgi:hypothetical protein